jgi:hypothetical protein
VRFEFLLFGGAFLLFFMACLIPARWLPPLPNDKLLHFLAFAVLAFLLKFVADSKSELLLYFCGLIFAGWGIEVLQNWVPGRKFCWRDIGANTAGVLLVAILCL